MPRLWNETIEAHRRQVREAIMDTAAALVGEHGLAPVTMSKIAEKAGIGRATLYKYFPDVEAILVAWHQRHVAAHLAHLEEVRDRVSDPGERLAAVLEAYGLIMHGAAQQHYGVELGALVHRVEHVAHAQRQLHAFLRDLLAEAAAAGDLRGDIAPDELAGFCQHALTAAGSLPSQAAVRRLVRVTLAGLNPAGQAAR